MRNICPCSFIKLSIFNFYWNGFFWLQFAFNDNVSTISSLRSSLFLYPLSLQMVELGGKQLCKNCFLFLLKMLRVSRYWMSIDSQKQRRERMVFIRRRFRHFGAFRPTHRRVSTHFRQSPLEVEEENDELVGKPKPWLEQSSHGELAIRKCHEYRASPTDLYLFYLFRKSMGVNP